MHGTNSIPVLIHCAKVSYSTVLSIVVEKSGTVHYNHSTLQSCTVLYDTARQSRINELVIYSNTWITNNCTTITPSTNAKNGWIGGQAMTEATSIMPEYHTIVNCLGLDSKTGYNIPCLCYDKLLKRSTWRKDDTVLYHTVVVWKQHSLTIFWPILYWNLSCMQYHTVQIHIRVLLYDTETWFWFVPDSESMIMIYKFELFN